MYNKQFASSRQAYKRLTQQSQVRTNEPTNSQNSPIGQDIESSFYDYFQNTSFDEESQFGNQQGAALEEGKHEHAREQGTSSGGHNVPGPRVHFNQSEAGHGPGFNSSRFSRWKKQQLTPSIRGRLANEAIVCYHHARTWTLNSVSSMRASDNSG